MISWEEVTGTASLADILSVAPGLTYAYKRTLFIAEVPIIFSRYIRSVAGVRFPNLNLRF